MWYGFCGPVVASQAAFEGKMEELCRELGERGKGGTTSGGCSSASHSTEQMCDEAQRVSALAQCLECSVRLLLVVPRHRRSGL
eukprot:COSAG01_NODE_68538_length_263_cov_1496.420732_1_plen_82_part_01